MHVEPPGWESHLLQLAEWVCKEMLRKGLFIGNKKLKKQPSAAGTQTFQNKIQNMHLERAQTHFFGFDKM